MKIKSCFLTILLTALAGLGSVSGQQKAIARIDAMPNKPAPYKTFDWKLVAKSYDELVFNTKVSGQYLPITSISTEAGVNYPSINPMLMKTFVGQDVENVAEAINILPALIGSSLVGIDKTNQAGVNWVEKSINFFNKANGQNVYLNNYSAGTGGDWWYEIMPNVFFYQLYSLYPNGSSEFAGQFQTVADRQLEVVYKLGGTQSPWQYPNMNYRAFNLLTGQPLDNGVKEPESAGSIAWILYEAYLKTQNNKYLIGAQMALDFLQNETANPSYEIQLPYGILAAAKLNAIENTEYDIDKFLNWTFSDGKNTLRKWGTIVGNWNGYDMSGLIGEANDQGDDYAFLMNGFQHAAALAPVAKYDKRYSKAIAKWLLNLSNASRFFYVGNLPDANMEATSLAWSKQNDVKASIPFESIKQKSNGVSPFAMGDALTGGWAQTNLSLYSGAGVGYLASIVSNTNLEGILQLDLNATDFGSNDLDTYLYYNPNAQAETVNLTLPSGTYSVYDVISQTALHTNASGTVQINIPADDVRQVVIYPSGSTVEMKNRILQLTNGQVVDYHYAWNYDTLLRIKSLYASTNEILVENDVEFVVLPENQSGTVKYEWYVNNERQDADTDKFVWKASSVAGKYEVESVVISEGQSASKVVEVNVVSSSDIEPVISDITIEGSNPRNLSSVLPIVALANTTDVIEWTVSGGTLNNNNTLTPEWTLPSEEGIYTLNLTVKNNRGETSKSVQVLVKDTDKKGTYSPVIYYPMNGNTLNAASSGLNAISVGAIPTVDAQGEANKAYRFENRSQYMHTANDALINFQDQMTLSFWINPSNIGDGEQFILSHGSWEERYKVSLTPDKKVRFTLNTTDRIVDIDDPTVVENNVYVHYTFVFTGYSVEVYKGGSLVAFTPLGGKINKSSKDLTIARRDLSTVDYTYPGNIDEVRLYNVALDVQSITELPTIFEDVASTNVEIKTLTVDGVEWDVNNQYKLECDNNKGAVTVNIEPYIGATIDKNTFEVDVTKPGIKNVVFTITSEDGSTKKEYTLKIEVPFKSTDLISQKWNKVLIVNNNSSNNGGFKFIAYEWFKDGKSIGTKQHYFVGNAPELLLDPNALYSVVVTTEDNDKINICPFKVTLKNSVSVNVYPTQVRSGESICIDADMEPEMLSGSEVQVYTIEGNLVKNIQINNAKTYFDLQNSGIYLLKYQTKDGYKSSFKLIVK